MISMDFKGIIALIILLSAAPSIPLLMSEYQRAYADQHCYVGDQDCGTSECYEIGNPEKGATVLKCKQSDSAECTVVNTPSNNENSQCHFDRSPN